MQPSRLAFASLLLTLAGPALPSDGVREINHACAVQTGCFAGDTAAFPVAITTPGSYVLTSNLVVPDENTTGILVGAPSVSIDLNGFEIVRAGCEAATVDCTPASGIGSGVEASAAPLPGISVENGSVTGMGSHGVLLDTQAAATNLRLRWNLMSGITALSARISGNSVYENGGWGIYAGAASTVSGNSVYENGGDGITTQIGEIVSGNTVRGNGAYGLNLTIRTVYRENNVTFNATGAVISGVNRRDNYCDGPGVVSANCP